jgi:hypothetical protein
MVSSPEDSGGAIVKPKRNLKGFPRRNGEPSVTREAGPHRLACFPEFSY